MESHLRYEYRIPFLGGTLLSMEIELFFDRKIPIGVSNSLKSTNREVN